MPVGAFLAQALVPLEDPLPAMVSKAATLDSECDEVYGDMAMIVQAERTLKLHGNGNCY